MSFGRWSVFAALRRFCSRLLCPAPSDGHCDISPTALAVNL